MAFTLRTMISTQKAENVIRQTVLLPIVPLVFGLVAMAAPTFAQPMSDESASLEEKLAEQQAKNQDLRRRIAALEEVLKTDVCRNPEAAKALRDAGTAN